MPRYRVVHVVECPANPPPDRLITVSDSIPSLQIVGQTEERHGIRVPVGLRIVAELDAPTLDRAVDLAGQASMTLVGVVCFATGVRYGRPFPVLALQPLEPTGSYFWRQYFYGVIPMSASHSVPLDDLDLILMRLSELADQKTKERIALAVRWYTTGIGEVDLANRFLSYFIALEAIAPPLSGAFHKSGELAVCQTCGWMGIRGTTPTSAEKEKRTPHRAGMQHILSLVGNDRELYGRLNRLRNDMFHGLRNLDQMVGAVQEGVPSLEVAVGRGILTLLADGAGHEMSAGEPLHDEKKPQAVWEGTITDLSDELLNQALYRHELFSIEVRDCQVNLTEEGTVVKGRLIFSGPNLPIAHYQPPRVLPVEGLEWGINIDDSQPETS
jgi:hypothetical protein